MLPYKEEKRIQLLDTKVTLSTQLGHSGASAWGLHNAAGKRRRERERLGNKSTKASRGEGGHPHRQDSSPWAFLVQAAPVWNISNHKFLFKETVLEEHACKQEEVSRTSLN